MSDGPKMRAVVTGGGTGVGRATALLLAKRGYDVAINYSRSESEAEHTVEQIREHGVDAFSIQADVSDRSQVVTMTQAIQSRWSGLDVAVNNAATTHFIGLGDLDEITDEVWDQILSVNLKGAFWVAQQMVPLMEGRPSASIVNVASMAGVTGAGSCLPYAASKGAMMTMTKSLARGLAPQVRVNAVCPGPVDSAMTESVTGDAREKYLSRYTILNRSGHPSEIAHTVLSLAMPASAFATGSTVIVDGGLIARST